MVYDSEDPAGFSIVSRNLDTQERLNDYWSRRARGYSLNTLLGLHNTSELEHLIEKHVPKGRKAFILDIGTSCGLVAITAARMGHIVSAVDIVPAMISHASKNAEKMHLQIDFSVADAQNLSFLEKSFDLIIAKSSIWCMTNPVAAMKDWMNLLRPGGHLLIIDGNYYLGHFESDYAKKLRISELSRSESSGMHGKTNMDKVNFSELHDISLDLPACSMRRPAWDVSVLIGMGMDNITVECTDKNPYRDIGRSGSMILPGNFTVSARRPPEGDSEGMFGGTGHLNGEIGTDDTDRNVAIMKALADPNRMKITQLLLSGEMNVKAVAERLGISVALASHNLSLLADTGLVWFKKVGKEKVFRLSDARSLEEIFYNLGKLYLNR